jgi:hypothetical protein
MVDLGEFDSIDFVGGEEAGATVLVGFEFTDLADDPLETLLAFGKTVLRSCKFVVRLTAFPPRPDPALQLGEIGPAGDGGGLGFVSCGDERGEVGGAVWGCLA